jgi:hypothetical protein
MAKTNTTAKVIEYTAEIKPLGGGPELETLVTEAKRSQRALQAVMQKHVPGAKLRIRRAEAFPLHHLLTLVLQIDWSHVRHVVEDAAIGAGVKAVIDKLGHKLDASVKVKQSAAASAAEGKKRAEGPSAKSERKRKTGDKTTRMPRRRRTSH